jgi:hypothetical protein
MPHLPPKVFLSFPRTQSKEPTLPLIHKNTNLLPTDKHRQNTIKPPPKPISPQPTDKLTTKKDIAMTETQ